MRKDNPPIPVGIETGGLESLQRFETHWKVQKKGNSFRMFRVGSGDGASTNLKQKKPGISYNGVHVPIRTGSVCQSGLA